MPAKFTVFLCFYNKFCCPIFCLDYPFSTFNQTEILYHPDNTYYDFSNPKLFSRDQPVIDHSYKSCGMVAFYKNIYV